MSATKTALIIGAGIAGPIAAVALRKAGIASTIYEAYATTAEGQGGAMMLAPNGLAALRLIGAEAAIRSIGQPIARMVLDDSQGKQLGEFGGLDGAEPSQLVWRSDLYRVLRDLAIANAIRIEYGKKLVRVAEAGHQITAYFDDGSSASGDILIGADGIRSSVRTLIDPAAATPQYTGLLGFGGRARVGDCAGLPGAMHFVFGTQAFLGHWREPDGGTAWFGNLPQSDPLTAAQARAVPALDWLRKLSAIYAADMPGRMLVEKTAAEDLIVTGAGEMLNKVTHWSKGRMVLVGDAVHAPSSSSGQGVSLAAESAIELARCLRDLHDPGAAFAAYERLRRQRVEDVAANAAKTNQNKAAGPVAKALMHILMPLALKTVFTPKKMFGAYHGYRIDWNQRVTE